jgi:hypothetical protein
METKDKISEGAQSERLRKMKRTFERKRAQRWLEIDRETYTMIDKLDLGCYDEGWEYISPLARQQMEKKIRRNSRKLKELSANISEEIFDEVIIGSGCFEGDFEYVTFCEHDYDHYG